MIRTKVFKITDMHCTSCALSVDLDLEEQNGVMESNTNYASGTSEVKYDDEKISEEKIIESIKKTGYTAVS